MSAWVTVYVAVQEVVASGARLPEPHAIRPAILVSLTVNGPVRVTLPLLVSVYS